MNFITGKMIRRFRYFRETSGYEILKRLLWDRVFRSKNVYKQKESRTKKWNYMNRKNM